MTADDLILKVLRERHEAIERGCALMLVDTERRGLLVRGEWSEDGLTYTTVCELTHDVPAMTIGYVLADVVENARTYDEAAARLDRLG